MLSEEVLLSEEILFPEEVLLSEEVLISEEVLLPEDMLFMVVELLSSDEEVADMLKELDEVDVIEEDMAESDVERLCKLEELKPGAEKLELDMAAGFDTEEDDDEDIESKLVEVVERDMDTVE